MTRNKALLLTAVVIASCSPNKPDINKMANEFSDIECRAMALREKRFALANQIRFTQDTLLHTSNKTDTTRLKTKLQVLNSEKENILKTSLSLADSIKHRLDSLMENHLATPEDKAKFNELLKAALQKRGCVE